jgi:hypothetical protein
VFEAVATKAVRVSHACGPSASCDAVGSVSL